MEILAEKIGAFEILFLAIYFRKTVRLRESYYFQWASDIAVSFILENMGVSPSVSGLKETINTPSISN